MGDYLRTADSSSGAKVPGGSVPGLYDSIYFLKKTDFGFQSIHLKSETETLKITLLTWDNCHTSEEMTQVKSVASQNLLKAESSQNV